MSNNQTSQLIRRMIIVILVYGVICSVPILIFTKDRFECELGLVIGLLLALGMLLHMNMVIKKSVFMEGGESKYLAFNSILRLIIVLVVMGICTITHVANVLTILLGAMGLKVAAYAQPFIEKISTQEKGR